MAKAIHVPVRRREEAATAPTMAMRAAAVNLAVVLRRNFEFQVGAAWQQVPALLLHCCSATPLPQSLFAR